MQYRVISADNHILEPPNLFLDRLPERYRDQAPRLVRGKDGGDGWSLDGSIPESTVGLPWGLGAVNPGARIRIAPRGLLWEELVPGNYDGAAHIKDMASDVSTPRSCIRRWCIARTPGSRIARSDWSA